MNWFDKLFKRNREEIIKMKYLVVGLGNMGVDYDDTRHNVGFEVVDRLAKTQEAGFKNDRLGDIAEFSYRGRHVYLLKPSTYMNLSGKAVHYWMIKLKIKPEHILIVLDDLNLDFKKIKLRDKGSHGGHNGLKDIQSMLGSDKYARLRIGIGDNFPRGRQVDFVLGKWSNKEAIELPEVLERATAIILSYLGTGLINTKNNHGC